MLCPSWFGWFSNLLECLLLLVDFGFACLNWLADRLFGSGWFSGAILKILLLEAGRCGIITNSNVQSVRFGRLAQRERRCLTSTRPGVQIPHRPPLTQRPPAMEVFFVSGEDPLDLNPARGLRYARKAIWGTRHSPHGLARTCSSFAASRCAYPGLGRSTQPYSRTCLARANAFRAVIRVFPKIILSEKQLRCAKYYCSG